MKIVFIGSSKFGLKCLKEVFNIPEVSVVGIITNPPTFSISYNKAGVTNVLHDDFHPFAEEKNIPIRDMITNMKELSLVDQIKEWEPDFILVVGWYHMIPKEIRDIAPTGGLHASLLPDYSGGAPLVWAMINGEGKTGITFFLFNDKVDGGPIIGQKEETIYYEDTIASLYARIEGKGLELLKEQIPKIRDGSAVYREQDETKRRIMPQRTPDDGEIDLSKTSIDLYNFIRAQSSPYPGAFIRTIDGKKLIIEKAKVE